MILLWVVIMFTLSILTLLVEFIYIPFHGLDGVDHFDLIIALWMSWMQSISLMFYCDFYCVLLDRIQIIEQELQNVAQRVTEFQKISKREKDQLIKPIIESYSKCATLINTFDVLKNFVTRNFWLHCVYDLIFGYKGGRVYWNRYVEGDTTVKGAIVDVISSFWNIYNVLFTVLLINLSYRLQEKVCMCK